MVADSPYVASELFARAVSRKAFSYPLYRASDLYLLFFVFNFFSFVFDDCFISVVFGVVRIRRANVSNR